MRAHLLLFSGGWSLLTGLLFTGQVLAQRQYPVVRPQQAAGLPANRVQVADDANWRDGFEQPRVYDVNVMVELANGDLVVGGAFGSVVYPDQYAGGVVNAQNVARWDGQRWRALGGGLPNEVTALTSLPTGHLLAATVSGTNAQLLKWDNVAWQPVGGSLNGRVRKLLVLSGGEVLVAGSFTDAGGEAAADYLARWDGTAWHAVGASPLNAAVNDVALNSAGHLLVGGAFTDAGSEPLADYVARWDGAGWQPLDSGLTAEVTALLVNLNGDVLAGQKFTSDAVVARYDGTHWRPLTTRLGMGGYTWGIQCMMYLPTGELVVGGGIRAFNAGTGNRRGIVSWDGTQWNSVGGLVAVGVKTFLINSAGQLVAGGFNYIIDGIHTVSNGLMRYDGARWVSYGGGLLSAQGPSRVLVRANGEVLVGGDFGTSDPDVQRMVRWTGTGWAAMNAGIEADHAVTDLIETPTGELYIATAHVITGLAQVLRWDGTRWQQVTAPLMNQIWSLAVAPNGDILAGGMFTIAGGTTAAYLARWDGTNWQPVGAGLNHWVSSVQVGPTGDIAVGGYFTNAGGNAAADYVARWDGTAWQALGSGVDSAVVGLQYLPNGDLLVAGCFHGAGGNPNAKYIARWDGTAWNALGSGLNGPAYSTTVLANGDVVVGGRFVDAGGNPNADRIARWDGTTWNALGSGLNGPVASVSVNPNGAVIGVAGAFTRVGDGSKPTSYFALYELQTTTGLAASSVVKLPLGLYPNPAHQKVRIETSEAASAALLFDGVGRLVRRAALTDGQGYLALEGLVPGLYVVRVGSASQRVVVE